MTRHFDRSKRTNRRSVPSKPAAPPPVRLPDLTDFLAAYDAEEDARNPPAPPPPQPEPAPPAEDP